MTCVKTAELIEMQFGIFTESAASRDHVLHRNLDAPRERTLEGVSGQLKSIVFSGGVSCAKKVDQS